MLDEMENFRITNCQRCKRQVLVLDSGFARHLGADGGVYASCRAASFQVGLGWDESIDRKWKVKPV
jgi:hypothetical protein